MHADKGNGKKGFAGLDSMVSDVEAPAVPEPAKASPLPPPKREPAREEPAPTQPAYSAPASSGEGSGKWWAIGIGIAVLFVWASGSDKKSSARTAPSAPSYSYSAPAPAARPAPYYPPAAPAYVPEPAPASASDGEEMPPVGSGLSYNRAQIRYCLSEKIRISAWQEQVDQYSETSVDAFNMAVNDYNMRCSNFRYRSGMLESVRSEVESNRYALQLEGMRSALANP